MSSMSVDDESSTPTAIEIVGEVCARALAIAVVVGLLEGMFLGRGEIGAPQGLALATAGLWTLPALVLSGLRFPYDRVVRGDGDRSVGVAMAVGLVAASSFFLVLSRHGVSTSVAIAPVELFGSLLSAWAVAHLRPTGGTRRVVAIVGLVGIVLLQIFATRWIDSNRAFASLLIDGTWTPRLLLRTVLHRFV